jgi:hypothetical protein
MMALVMVSPMTRCAVCAPSSFVPVVLSVPAEVPFTVRSVLPDASPATVRSLSCSTSLVVPFRRVVVPLHRDAHVQCIRSGAVVRGLHVAAPIGEASRATHGEAIAFRGCAHDAAGCRLERAVAERRWIDETAAESDATQE